MQKYETPDLEVVLFQEEDIICSSIIDGGEIE